MKLFPAGEGSFAATRFFPLAGYDMPRELYYVSIANQAKTEDSAQRRTEWGR
jgi:hypothetical protein